MLKEEAKLVPASLYAETKLMGELKVRESTDNYLILRSALLYGFGHGNRKSHFHQMYDNLKNGNRVNLFNDQYRTPLSLPEAAKIIAKLVKPAIKNEIINIGGKERISRVELGELLCKAANFDRKLIREISMKDVPGYPVVEDVSMDTGKLQSLGVKLKSVQEAIKEILNSV